SASGKRDTATDIVRRLPPGGGILPDETTEGGIEGDLGVLQQSSRRCAGLLGIHGAGGHGLLLIGGSIARAAGQHGETGKGSREDHGPSVMHGRRHAGHRVLLVLSSDPSVRNSVTISAQRRNRA